MITKEDAIQSLWICSALALVIIFVRLSLIRYCHSRFDAADHVAIVGGVVIVVRMVTDHYLLAYGTIHDARLAQTQSTHQISAERLQKYKTGSILSLVARLLDTTFFWLCIAILLLFYSKLLELVRWARIAIKVCWTTLAVTYVIVVLATFLECHPFSLYLQLQPDPGKCVLAYSQLLLQGISNSILDLIILAISIPVLRPMSGKNKTPSQIVRLAIMFSFGFFCLAITILRIIYVYRTRSAQPIRTMFASIQLVGSAFVANVPTIYGRFMMGRRKRGEAAIRRASRPEAWSGLETVKVRAPQVQHNLGALGSDHVITPAELPNGRANTSQEKPRYTRIEDIRSAG